MNISQAYGFSTYDCILSSQGRQSRNGALTLGTSQFVTCIYTSGFAEAESFISLSVDFGSGALVLTSPYNLYAYASQQNTPSGAGTATVGLSTTTLASTEDVMANLVFMSALMDALQQFTGGKFIVQELAAETPTATPVLVGRRRALLTSSDCPDSTLVRISLTVVGVANGSSIADVINALNSADVQAAVAAALQLSQNQILLDCFTTFGSASSTTTNAGSVQSKSDDVVGLALGLGIGLGVFFIVTASIGTVIYIRQQAAARQPALANQV
eukprot:CAMPEP_0184672214 /NCGR_PEP_ID=MMETSP0308-20130426/85967_1 /TAXON_ID=38269 /ORGANISM="Gloeochaete witrockiana, Strain SAG 46.84" /LENGTH=270 /DNA_ID=CAMNT_0027119505 /DNA_START=353 /DNA_END=1165 /DNA_ORIENTATION=+